jgi:hypothetical protein
MTTDTKIVQFADDAKTLPDGSKIIYAQSPEKIVLYHKIPFEMGLTYVFDRKDQTIKVNGKAGDNADKRKMIKLGAYFLEHAGEDDLVTLDIQTKD